MSEIVNVIALDNPNLVFPMERASFYKEQTEIYEKTWKPTKAVELVNVFLFNEAWQMIIQKRASSKAHNPDLMDKAVGGHIVHWDTPHFTVMLETIQELQVPSIVASNDEDFRKIHKLLKDYMATTAVVKYIWSEITSLKKIINGKEISIGNKTHLYIWIYEWSVKNVDREAKGILFYSLEELEDELNRFPQIFTYDLQYYYHKYKDYFRNFISEIKK